MPLPTVPDSHPGRASPVGIAIVAAPPLVGRGGDLAPACGVSAAIRLIIASTLE